MAMGNFWAMSNVVHVNMLGKGGVETDKPFAIVVAQFNELVTKSLLDGAIDELNAICNNPKIEVCHVPGSFEIPLIVKVCFYIYYFIHHHSISQNLANMRG